MFLSVYHSFVCRYGKVFNKKSRKWSLYVIKEDKDYAYIRDLQSAIIEKKLSSSAVPRKSKKRPDDSRQYGVLSGIPAPSTGELLDTLVSRGLGKLYLNMLLLHSIKNCN